MGKELGAGTLANSSHGKNKQKRNDWKSAFHLRQSLTTL